MIKKMRAKLQEVKGKTDKQKSCQARVTIEYIQLGYDNVPLYCKCCSTFGKIKFGFGTIGNK